METKKTTTKKTTTVAKKNVASKSSASAKKTTTAKKTTAAVTKKPAAKKVVATKKQATTKKVAASKTTAKKTTAKKPTVVKKTTTAKKTTVTKKPAAKKTTVSKVTEAKIEKLIENIDKPVDKIERLTKESEKVTPIIEEPVIYSEPVKEEPVKVHTENMVVIRKKRKLKIKPLLKLLCIIAALVLISLYVPKVFNEKDSYKDKATYTNAFFIRNNKGKYALFNDKGKRLTKFVFDSVNTFVDDSALVYKEKEGYAVIDNKGKEVIKYGEYNYLSSYSGIYKVRSDKGYKLLDSNGKKILEAEELDVTSFGDDYPFIIATANNEVRIISYDGTTIKKLKQNKSTKSPTVNHINEYASLFYNGENIIFNSKTKKVITTFKKDNHYCVSNVSEDGKILTLNACTSWYESLDKEGHMIVVKGNVTDLTDKCSALNIYDDVVICATSDGASFVNIKGKKATIGDKVSNRTAFIDEENYVTRSSDSLKLEFYKKGKKVKTMDASLSSVGKVNSGMYVFYVDNGYEYYNKEGKQAIKENFKYASVFDKNGIARVSKDGTNYYLINEKGKKISDEYKSINNYDAYYLVSNEKGLKGVIDKKGKTIIETKYASINIKELRDSYYAITSSENGKYALYNLDDKKLVKESKHQISISEHYIKVSGNKTSYYTYKDKLIFEE